MRGHLRSHLKRRMSMPGADSPAEDILKKEPADHQEMPYRAAIRRAFASSLSYRLAWTFFAGLEARGCAVSGAAAVSGLRVSGWTASALGASGLAVSVTAGVSLAASTRPRLPPA